MTPPLDLPKISDLPALVAALTARTAALEAAVAGLAGRAAALEADRAVLAKVASIESQVQTTRVELRRLREKARRR